MSQPRQLILKQYYRAIDFEGVIEPSVYFENDPKLMGKAEYLVESGRAEWVPAGNVVVGAVQFFAGTPTPAATGTSENPPPEEPKKPEIDRAIYASLNKAQLMELGETNGVQLPKSLTNDEMIDALIVKGIVPQAGA